ncbi:hypothetical protein NPIL_50411 [Nephila pilipes]|uniref:Uncharacterized protein n=1 Tax=Nephila pilipes TaxID=299642 RepID=A0A8X6P327_NEPPI|nr:hypothetical protein NPIL_50411 [Nephila pilipes]
MDPLERMRDDEDDAGCFTELLVELGFISICTNDVMTKWDFPFAVTEENVADALVDSQQKTSGMNSSIEQPIPTSIWNGIAVLWSFSSKSKKMELRNDSSVIQC